MEGEIEVIFAQVKSQVRASDFTGAFDQIMGLVPVGLKIVGFVILAMLLYRAAKSWKTLSITDMAAIVIAFALVGGR